MNDTAYVPATVVGALAQTWLREVNKDVVSKLTGTAKLRAADCAKTMKTDRPGVNILDDG